MCSWTEDEETLCARVQLFTLWSPFSSLLSPCSFQPLPCLGSALHSSHLIPGLALPALLLQLLPPPCTRVSPKHSTLLPTTSSSLCLLLQKVSASPVTPLKMLFGCWTHLFFPQVMAVLMQKETQKAALILHTKDFREEESDSRSKNTQTPQKRKTFFKC